MKILLSTLLFSLSFVGVFAAEPVAIGTYDFYLQNVDTFCKPTDANLWSKWKDNSFLMQEQILYADITKKDKGDVAYKAFLKAIKSDPSRIDTIWLSLKPVFLDKAAYVYRETMNTIYSCAVMNSKVRIFENLLTKIPTVQSNLKQQLTTQLKHTISAMKEKCRTITDSSELSLKKAVLDNTTYQYCNYRQYLYYLDYTSKNTLNNFYASKNGSGNVSSFQNTDAAALEIAQSANRIVSEIAHAKEVFPQAMVAYTEFEKTYASHVILEFILQDYINLRTTLKQLLNPIGQVIYKISNAQAK